jgi:hypothetical protein
MAEQDWIELWIDELVKVFEVETGDGGNVRGFRVYEKDEFPAEIPLDRPTALTYVDGLDAPYSQGSGIELLWHGSTDFHLTPNTDRRHLPKIMRYYKRIVKAAAQHCRLNGKVDIFLLEESGSVNLQVFQYGQEAKHLGLEIKWLVKQVITDIAMGDPSIA